MQYVKILLIMLVVAVNLFAGAAMPGNAAVEETFNQLRPKAERGDAGAQFNLGVLYLAARDYAQAAQWFRKAAEQGHREAQYRLAVMCWGGQGVPQSDAEAEKWFRLAAQQGDTDAARRAKEIQAEMERKKSTAP